MSRDIAALVASMTVEEKAAFTAGADFWTLVANERVGIPPIRVTDGPNGARGARSSASAARPRCARRADRRSARPGIPTWSSGWA